MNKKSAQNDIVNQLTERYYEAVARHKNEAKLLSMLAQLMQAIDEEDDERYTPNQRKLICDYIYYHYERERCRLEPYQLEMDRLHNQLANYRVEAIA